MRNLLVLFLAVASTGAVFIPKTEWSELENLVPATYFKIILNTEELYNDQSFYQRVYFLVLKNLKYFVQTLYARQNFLNQYVECSCPDGKFNPAILPQYWGQKFDFETPVGEVLTLHREGYEYSRKMSEALKIVSNECPRSAECLNKFNNRFMDFLSGKEDTMINEFVFHQYLPFFFPKVFEPLYTADIFYPFQQAWGQFLSTYSAVPFTGFDFFYPHYDSFMSTPYFGKHYAYDFAHPSHFGHYGMNFNMYPYSKYFDYPYSKYYGGFNDKYPFYHNYDSKFGFNYPYYNHFDTKFGFNYPYYNHFDTKFGFNYPYYNHFDTKFGSNYPYYNHFDTKFGFNYPYYNHFDTKFGSNYPYYNHFDTKFGFNYPYHHSYDTQFGFNYPYYHNYDSKFGFNYPYHHSYDTKFDFNYPYYHNYDAKFGVSHYPYFNHFDSKFSYPYSYPKFESFPFGNNYYSGFSFDKTEPKYFENMEVKK